MEDIIFKRDSQWKLNYHHSQQLKLRRRIRHSIVSYFLINAFPLNILFIYMDHLEKYYYIFFLKIKLQ